VTTRRPPFGELPGTRGPLPTTTEPGGVLIATTISAPPAGTIAALIPTRPPAPMDPGAAVAARAKTPTGPLATAREFATPARELAAPGRELAAAAGPAGPAGIVASRPTPPEINLTPHRLPDGPLDPRLVLATHPDSERAAGFRVLRHHLLEVGRPQVIVVASPRGGDGKTTTALGLALALAECGRAKVLLVETHFRRPALARMFQMTPSWCFAEQLTAHRNQPTMPWAISELPQLFLHTAVLFPQLRQTQLLDAPAFAIAMERMRAAGYDHVVVDAPPVLGSADVNLLADAADGVVLALRARRSTARDLRAAIEQIGEAKIAGTVLIEG
jgi:Mrp family chromosome partitioning ATPase